MALLDELKTQMERCTGQLSHEWARLASVATQLTA
jgi:hypothetical protein